MWDLLLAILLAIPTTQMERHQAYYDLVHMANDATGNDVLLQELTIAESRFSWWMQVSLALGVRWPGVVMTPEVQLDAALYAWDARRNFYWRGP